MISVLRKQTKSIHQHRSKNKICQKIKEIVKKNCVSLSNVIYFNSYERGGMMFEKNEIARKNEETNEILNSLKRQEKDLKTILRKIEKMQEFHEINDMTNQVFEWRLSCIEGQLNQINDNLKAI